MISTWPSIEYVQQSKEKVSDNFASQVAWILSKNSVDINLEFIEKAYWPTLSNSLKDLLAYLDDWAGQNSSVKYQINSILNNFSLLAQQTPAWNNIFPKSNSIYQERLVNRLISDISILIWKVNSGELKNLPALENWVKNNIITLQKYLKANLSSSYQVVFSEIK